MNLPKEFIAIPEEYKVEATQKGKVEKLYYDTTDPKGQPDHKYLFVYTPYGYDETKEYEILYLIHGGHELQDKYMYLQGEENPLKRYVDNMIEKGDIKPCIICLPSWYPHNTISDEIDSRLLTMDFHKQLSDVIMPWIETKYHTFAKTADDKGFTESREHRAIMGWSMGSATTWFVQMRLMRYFNRFGNMSADCFIVRPQGCVNFAGESVAALAYAVKNQGYEAKDYTIMAATGTNDGLRPGMVNQMAEMAKYPELWKFEGDDKNIAFYLWEGGEHHTEWRLIYTFNVIKTIMNV